MDFDTNHLKHYHLNIQSNPAILRSPRAAISNEDQILLDWFTLMFSVIYYQLFRTRLFRIPRYFEVIVFFLHHKSTPLFRTCPKQSTYIRRIAFCNSLLVVEGVEIRRQTSQLSFTIDKSIRKNQKQQNIQRFLSATASADLSDI